MSVARTLVAIVAALSTLALARDAAAQSTVWQRARDPQRFVDEEAKAAAVTELERERTDNVVRLTGLYNPTYYRQRARSILEDAGAPTSTDAELRLIYARLLVDLGEPKRGGAIIEAALKESLPPDLATDAWNDLALARARLGDVEGWIDAYERAIELEPLPRHRASLLANQAEAFMFRGDIERAIEGYKASLASRTSVELADASTTYFSLGVAYDRGGDLEAALAQVGSARVYDRTDSRLSSREWIYIPDYDEPWFMALGHLYTARFTDDDDIRASAYEASAMRYEEFVARAPETNPYRALAEARAMQVRREASALVAKTRAPANSKGPSKGKRDASVPRIELLPKAR